MKLLLICCISWPNLPFKESRIADKSRIADNRVNHRPVKQQYFNHVAVAIARNLLLANVDLLVGTNREVSFEFIFKFLQRYVK